MNRFQRPMRALGLWMLVAPAALAGLPLVCHPFATDDSPALPWGAAQGPLTIDSTYDTAALVTDTLRLLSPEAPVLARMENMRRATVYATRDPRAADALLVALLERVNRARGSNREITLAKFDAGYLIESYRQHGMTLRLDLLGRFDVRHPGERAAAGALDGYQLVKSAWASSGDREIAYAAALMAPDQSSRDQLLEAARRDLPAGTPLAQNLAR